MNLWFSLTFINIPLFTILLGGFDIIAVDLVVIVDATVDVVGLTVDVVGLTVDVDSSVVGFFLTVDVSGSLSANINKTLFISTQ